MVIEGKIIAGAGQAGNQIGVPTANIEVLSGKMNSSGVYTCLATINEKEYRSICFIGKAYLLEGNPERLEVHLLDEKKPDLEAQAIHVNLLEKLRDEMKFESIEQAKEIIQQDLAQAKKWFSDR